MVMLATHYDFVIGGDPDRDTMDLAVVDTRTGGVAASVSDTADGDGYSRMLGWARNHAPVRRVWALEGTGSFAAGFVAVLAGAGEDVVEITGDKRRRGAKNDRIDAIQAARTALSSEHQATPRSRGLREALRQVMTTRQAVLVSRTKAINELKSLIVVAPEYLRAPLRGCSLLVQLRRIEDLPRPTGGGCRPSDHGVHDAFDSSPGSASFSREMLSPSRCPLVWSRYSPRKAWYPPTVATLKASALRKPCGRAAPAQAGPICWYTGETGRPGLELAVHVRPSLPASRRSEPCR